MSDKSSIPKILVVDDDKFFVEFYRTELSQFNLQTEYAMDGEEAIRKAIEIVPDIILLDVLIPIKDGFEVLSELKKNEITKHIPVVINSSLSNKSDIDKLKELGAVHFFNKLVQLPTDVAKYIQESLVSGFDVSESQVEITTDKSIALSTDQINTIFKDSLKEIESSLNKLFQKLVSLKDMNVVMMSYSQFTENITGLAKLSGTIFIYSNIDSAVPGVAILSMKRDATLSLIKLIEDGVAGKDLGLDMSDHVIEEFVNIILNSFLTKLSSSISGKFLLTPTTIINGDSLLEILSDSQIQKDNMVVFLEQVYTMDDLNLSFSLFIIFGSKLFLKNSDEQLT